MFMLKSNISFLFELLFVCTFPSFRNDNSNEEKRKEKMKKRKKKEKLEKMTSLDVIIAREEKHEATI